MPRERASFTFVHRHTIESYRDDGGESGRQTTQVCAPHRIEWKRNNLNVTAHRTHQQLCNCEISVTEFYFWMTTTTTTRARPDQTMCGCICNFVCLCSNSLFGHSAIYRVSWMYVISSTVNELLMVCCTFLNSHKRMHRITRLNAHAAWYTWNWRKE